MEWLKGLDKGKGLGLVGVCFFPFQIETGISQRIHIFEVVETHKLFQENL
jgi:hypothetical protein